MASSVKNNEEWKARIVSMPYGEQTSADLITIRFIILTGIGGE